MLEIKQLREIIAGWPDFARSAFIRLIEMYETRGIHLGTLNIIPSNAGKSKSPVGGNSDGTYQNDVKFPVYQKYRRPEGETITTPDGRVIHVEVIRRVFDELTRVFPALPGGEIINNSDEKECE